MENTPVSGYRNYETFHVAMFLSNNRPQYDWCKQQAKQCLEYKASALCLSDLLETYVRDSQLGIDQREGKCRSDQDYLAHELLTAALARVDWKQIADEWIQAWLEGTRR